MDNQETWIESRLASALEAAATKEHVFPEALRVEFRKLLAGELQEPRKPSELEEIALKLGAANRGDR
jgi:hypothetical protein